MTRSYKILIPIDFSANTQKAILNVKRLIEQQAAEVLLVYVNTPDSLVNEHEIYKAFKAFEASALKLVSFNYHFEIRKGTLLKEIARASEFHKPDLVIMGTRERLPDVALTSELIRLRRQSEALLETA